MPVGYLGNQLLRPLLPLRDLQSEAVNDHAVICFDKFTNGLFVATPIRSKRVEIYTAKAQVPDERISCISNPVGIDSLQSLRRTPPAGQGLSGDYRAATECAIKTLVTQDDSVTAFH